MVAGGTERVETGKHLYPPKFITDYAVVTEVNEPLRTELLPTCNHCGGTSLGGRRNVYFKTSTNKTTKPFVEILGVLRFNKNKYVQYKESAWSHK